MARYLHFRPPLEAALLFAIIASAAVRVRAFHIPQSRPIHKVSLHASTTDSNNDDDDLWNADISPLQQQRQRHNSEEQYDWTWSILPLPEHADNTSIAERARCAMMSSSTNNHHHSNNKQPAALQDRCSVNLDAFHNGRCKAQWLHVDPPVLTVDNFLTEQECDDIRRITIFPPPAGVGRVIKLESRLSESNKSNNQGTAVRLSTTWYVRYGAPQVAPLLRSLMQLLPDIQLEQTEEVQLVRYMGEGQGFGWHEDALSEQEATMDAGGQRIATLLVYLDDCQDGSGRTLFRDLRGGGKDGKQCRLGVSPKKGRALLFFPAISTTASIVEEEDNTSSTNDEEDNGAFGNVYFDHTRADHRTTHAGEPPTGQNGQKHIAQLWIHSGKHTPVVFGRGLNRHSEAVL